MFDAKSTPNVARGSINSKVISKYKTLPSSYRLFPRKILGSGHPAAQRTSSRLNSHILFPKRNFPNTHIDSSQGKYWGAAPTQPKERQVVLIRTSSFQSEIFQTTHIDSSQGKYWGAVIPQPTERQVVLIPIYPF